MYDPEQTLTAGVKDIIFRFGRFLRAPAVDSQGRVAVEDVEGL